MSVESLLAEGGFNWVGLGITLAALAIGWTILRFVLRLTMRLFFIGCVGLLILVGLAFAAFQLLGT